MNDDDTRTTKAYWITDNDDPPNSFIVTAGDITEAAKSGEEEVCERSGYDEDFWVTKVERIGEVVR